MESRSQSHGSQHALRQLKPLEVQKFSVKTKVAQRNPNKELTTQPFEFLPANGLPPAPPPLESEPPHRKLARLAREHTRTVETLKELKKDWVTKNIQPQATRQPISTARTVRRGPRLNESHKKSASRFRSQ